MVIQHREAINCIALSLIHKSQRTKALVLELLAAICLVKGGHEIILCAFDNFKKVTGETKRFETLLDMFVNFTEFNVDFMIDCMQFMNIVVHSVEDINYRVHLQYEFTALGLDEYLEKLRLTESEDLQVQISAYLDNVLDVSALMEDSITKTAALERINELEDDLGRASDRIAEIERDASFSIANMQTDLQQLRLERDELMQQQRMFDEEMQMLKMALQKHEQESKSRESMLIELENFSKTLPKGTSWQDVLKSGKLSPRNESLLSLDQLQVNSTSPPAVVSSAPPPPPPPLPSSQMAANPPAAPPGNETFMIYFLSIDYKTSLFVVFSSHQTFSTKNEWRKLHSATTACWHDGSTERCHDNQAKGSDKVQAANAQLAGAEAQSSAWNDLQ